MSKGFIKVHPAQSSSMDYYLRNGECLERFHSTGNKTDREIKEEWKQIVNNEKYGNKELKIRGRHDARVSKNYVITLPNNLTPKENLDKLKELVKNTPIEKCTYTIAIHKGVKDGVTNIHAHLIVNERNLETMKKDRLMNSKDWLKSEFQVKYEKTFEKEFSQGKETIPRERIETYAYQADPQTARYIISQTQIPKEPVKEILSNESQLLELMKQYAEKKQEQEKPKEQEKEKAIDTEQAKTLELLKHYSEKVKQRQERMQEEKTKDIKQDRGYNPSR